MVVEEPEASADDGLAAAGRIKSEAEARSNVVVVAGNAFDDPESFFSGGVDRSRGREERTEFDVIADAVIEREFAIHLPLVLREKSHRNIIKGLFGISDALDVGGGNAESIGLRFRGAKLHKIKVSAEFKRVPAANDADQIGKFGAALDAIDGGVRLAAKVCDARDVDANIAAAGKLRETKVQAAPRVLEAGLVEIAIADYGVMLGSQVEVARLGQPRARSGVLPENLGLRSGRLAGDERR